MADDFQDSEDLQNETLQSDSPQEKSNVSPIWAVSARIVKESPIGYAGRETRRGTPKFNANQKVYVFDTYGPNWDDKVGVIGRYRGKYKYINVVLNPHFLTQFRVELLYSPTIIRYIQYGYSTPEENPLTPERISREWSIPLDGSEASHLKALSLVEFMRELADEYRLEKQKHIEDQRLGTINGNQI